MILVLWQQLLCAMLEMTEQLAADCYRILFIV